MRFLRILPLFLFMAVGVMAHTFPQHRLSLDWWKTRWEAQKAAVEEGETKILFIGDSLTQGFEGAGKEVWAEFYAPRGAKNFGISGDRTEHALWRLKRLDWSKVQPDVAIILIGSNDTGHKMQAAETTAAGVADCVEIVRAKSPETQVLVLGLLPRGFKNYAMDRNRNAEVNELLAHLDDGQNVHFLDVGSQFIAENGDLPTDLFPDTLHLSGEAYRMWAEAMEPKLAELLER